MKDQFTDDGYRLVRAYKHPIARSNGYALEHRLVAYGAGLIGIDDPRQVHHRNHDILDNRLENLEVMTVEEHIAATRRRTARR